MNKPLPDDPDNMTRAELVAWFDDDAPTLAPTDTRPTTLVSLRLPTETVEQIDAVMAGVDGGRSAFLRAAAEVMLTQVSADEARSKARDQAVLAHRKRRAA